MATKAAERARQWWYGRTQSPKGGHVDNEIVHALAAYEAATIERCAQVADGCKLGIEDCCDGTLERAAAAIRSIKGE